MENDNVSAASDGEPESDDEPDVGSGAENDESGAESDASEHKSKAARLIEGDWVEVYCSPENDWFMGQVVDVQDKKVVVYFEQDDTEDTVSSVGGRIRRIEAPPQGTVSVDEWSDDDVVIPQKKLKF